MGSRKVRRSEMLRSCDALGPEDGSDPREFFRKPSGRVPNRKALQLCEQVFHALGQVLGACADDVLRELALEAVRPAPNASRLLVLVSAPPGLAGVSEALDRAAGLLRSEAASAIHRRNAPELTFRVIARKEA